MDALEAGDRMSSQIQQDYALTRGALIIGRILALLSSAIHNISLQSGSKPLDPISHGISPYRNMPATRLNLAGSCPAGPQEVENISRCFLFCNKRSNSEPDIAGRARAHCDTDSMDVFLTRIDGFEPFLLKRLPQYSHRPAGYLTS
jgi:hypothetical protein